MLADLHFNPYGQCHRLLYEEGHPLASLAGLPLLGHAFYLPKAFDFRPAHLASCVGGSLFAAMHVV
jgi:hypothetical protein